MIIEFIGTPGAGKTTLMPVVMECLHEFGMQGFSVVEAARPCVRRTLLGKVVNRLTPTAWRERLLWQVFYYAGTLYQLKFSVQHLRLMRYVIVSQWGRPPAADVRRRRVLHWFFRLIGSYAFLTVRLRPDEALILDEGFLHRVVQMNASDVEEPDLARILAYVNLVPRPNVAIFPQALPETCEKRIYHRGLWDHFSHKNPAQISRYVANSHRVVNLTVDYIKSQGWTVIEIDNGGDDLTASRAELRSKLTKILTSAYAEPKLQKKSGTIGVL